MTQGVKAINILAELDRFKVKWEAAGGDEIRLRCPAHDDKTPSASLNVKDHVWKCYVPSCGASGDFVSLLALFATQPRAVVLADLQKRYPQIEGVSTIDSQTVEKFHKKLEEAGPLLDALRQRGVTDEMMRKARLGFHDGRITIPVYNEANQCVNVRRYLPGAPGPQKMRNTTGHAGPHLYRIETVKPEQPVLVCGGEMKALVAGELLGPHGIAAVCGTGGEGHWKDEWSKLFAGREVYVCLDVDNAGLAGARALAFSLSQHAKSVRILKLPLDKTRFPKGDINDWVGQCNAGANDFLTLIKETELWVAPNKTYASVAARGDVQKVDLDKAVTVGKVGQVIEVNAVIAASDQTPFLVPHEVDVDCSRDQPGCNICPVKMLQKDEHGWSRLTIDPGAPALIGMIGGTDREQTIRTAEALGVPFPATCKTAQFIPRSHHVAHDVRLTPPMDMAGMRGTDAWYPAVLVGRAMAELNVPMRMRGSIHPHPKTQQAVALISYCEELDDTLSTFSPSAQDIEQLRAVFSVTGGKTEGYTQYKLNEIYEDLESNVTWIFQRREMHLAYDLAWHSPLLFNFAGRQVNGWVNLLVLGDSAQGKSECALRLLGHYGCGDRVDCKNATVAGLLGGLEQLGNRWFVRWGAIPARDRTLLLLEELKGASTEVLSKLTDMRSSGIAELPKIERRRALARTRLVMISNPRSPRAMASFHFGVEAVLELIGTLEDVRRFDLAIAVGRGEVDDDIINMMPSKRPKVEHRVTAELSKKLILWSWTRKPDQVEFSDETVEQVATTAMNLTKRYSDAIPLVDQGTIRLKVARLSAALAARVFSSPDGARLVVHPYHVQLIETFMNKLYMSPVMGYEAYSSAQRLMTEIQDPRQVEKAIRSTKFPGDVAQVMLTRDTLSLEDVMSALSADHDTARQLLSLLVRKAALIRVNRTEYAKNPKFIEILKKIQATDKTSPNQHDVKGDEF